MASKRDNKPPSGFIEAPAGRARETAEGEAWVPDLRTVSADVPPTRVSACAPFFLRAHPDRWTVCGGELVPEFGRLVVQAGINGASDLGGKLDVNDARGMAERKGWVIVPVDAVPPEHVTPGQRPSYLYRPRGRPDVHLLIYERCFPGSERIERDDKRYVRFCKYLMERGIVPPPKAYALRQVAEKMQRQRDTLAGKAADHPSYTGALAESDKQLAVVLALLASIEASESASEAEDVALDLPVLA